MNTSRPESGIVHLGIGAFFRAFGCIYIADAMEVSGGDWGVVGVSLRSPETRDALQSQDWRYTSVTLSPQGEQCRSIDVLNDILFAPDDPQSVLEAMANPAIKIVSLTVTEKGYCHNPATGQLNDNHPDIQHDLVHELPVSAIGYMVRALQIRRKANLPPFTVLSCDNLPDNGKLVRKLVLELAQHIDPSLHDWIAEQGSFPSTMVDRITPATTDADIARVQELTGYQDAWPVLHEPFSQWVVEDKFVGGARPDLAAVGAEMVGDVSAYEHMKLRMLNGTHSALAYTGYLAGYQTIAETVADPVFERYARLLWTEIIATVTAPPGVDLKAYADALLVRYQNPKIHHRTWQIAMDGSQKLPQRILNTVVENNQAHRNCDGLLLAIGAWMRYVGGIDEEGQPIDVRDPLSSTLETLSASAGSPADKVTALLSVSDVFSTDLVKENQKSLIHAAQQLWSLGARKSIQQLL
ncbi:MAG: mannitol dehydrogenase family protein [Granulosicoccus sp.]